MIEVKDAREVEPEIRIVGKSAERRPEFLGCILKPARQLEREPAQFPCVEACFIELARPPRLFGGFRELSLVEIGARLREMLPGLKSLLILKWG